MKTIVLYFTAFVGSVSLASGTGAVLQKAAVKPTNDKKNDLVTVQSEVLEVGVKGMVCAFCAQGIEKKFMQQKEVQAIRVSLENKKITLTFKPGQHLSNAKISSLLKEAGYEANF